MHRGMTDLFRDRFAGILPCTLTVLTRIGEKLLGIIRDLDRGEGCGL